LLAALLSVAACFGVPGMSAAIPRPAYTSSYSVVWVEKARTPRQEVAESRKPAQVPRTIVAPLLPQDVAAPSARIDPTLFQRPPPPPFSRI
jgi:hypothetical protein